MLAQIVLAMCTPQSKKVEIEYFDSIYKIMYVIYIFDYFNTIFYFYFANFSFICTI